LPQEIITCLEMTSVKQLVPARRPPQPIEIEEVAPTAAPAAGATYVRIGAPLRWTSPRMGWSDSDWMDELSRPGVHAGLARVQGEVAGVLELKAEPSGEVGIVVFGLVPEFVGRGFGGAFLTLTTRLAWQVPLPSGGRVRRVWVQTSSRDHPHAIPNYERRGFRTFRIDRRD